jgi:HPt (histidine-containing phosphotransfer) domain-containing protein
MVLDYVASDVAKELGIDEALLELLIESFKSEADKEFNQLREAVSNGDEQTIRSLAHSIKGAASNLRFHTITAITATIESNPASVDVTQLNELENALNELA